MMVGAKTGLPLSQSASAIKQRKWRAENLDKARAYGRVYLASWRKRNPEKVLAANHRYLGMPTPTRPKPDLCECCSGPPVGRSGKLHLDHNHTTGAFRGWICSNCNTALGKFGDTLTGVLRAVDYLERNG